MLPYDAKEASRVEVVRLISVSARVSCCLKLRQRNARNFIDQLTLACAPVEPASAEAPRNSPQSSETAPNVYPVQSSAQMHYDLYTIECHQPLYLGLNLLKSNETDSILK